MKELYSPNIKYYLKDDLNRDAMTMTVIATAIDAHILSPSKGNSEMIM